MRLDPFFFAVLQPDIVVVCDQNKLDDRGCLGAPDLVIEILSPATAARDLKIKREQYEKYGVKEYWIVHPVDKFCMVYTLNEDLFYPKAQVFSAEDVVRSAAVKEIEIPLEIIFGKVAKEEKVPEVAAQKV